MDNELARVSLSKWMKNHKDRLNRALDNIDVDGFVEKLTPEQLSKINSLNFKIVGSEDEEKLRHAFMDYVLQDLEDMIKRGSKEEITNYLMKRRSM